VTTEACIARGSIHKVSVEASHATAITYGCKMSRALARDKLVVCVAYDRRIT
jgi:hypothetical protein